MCKRQRKNHTRVEFLLLNLTKWMIFIQFNHSLLQLKFKDGQVDNDNNSLKKRKKKKTKEKVSYTLFKKQHDEWLVCLLIFEGMFASVDHCEYRSYNMYTVTRQKAKRFACVRMCVDRNHCTVVKKKKKKKKSWAQIES